MGVWAWTSSVEVMIPTRKVKKAYEAVSEAYKSGKIRQSNYSGELAEKFKTIKDMASFLDFHFYKYEKSSAHWKITNCDIDKMNDEFCDIFAIIAPYVKPGSYIKVEDEEGGHLLMAFDGKEVKYFGDAY